MRRRVVLALSILSVCSALGVAGQPAAAATEVVRITCPSLQRLYMEWPKEAESERKFKLSAANTTSLQPNFRAAKRDGQKLMCTYAAENITATYTYTVNAEIVECRMPSPRTFECTVKSIGLIRP